MHRSPQANPLTKRRLDAAVPREKDYFLWCSRTRGFGCRVYPSSKRMFVVQVRFGHEQQRHKIGPYGPFTVEQARLRAEQVIRDIADGKNPRQLKITERQAITVSELLDRYIEASRAALVMTRFGRPKRPGTVVIDEGRIERHIRPLIGSARLKDVTQAPCSEWLTTSVGARRLASSAEGLAGKPS